MSITIDLPPATMEKLEAQAKAKGIDVESLIREAIDAKLLRGGRSFHEILQPIRDEVAQSGMTESELDQLIQSAIQGARADSTPDRP